MSAVVPEGATWIKENVTSFQPESSHVTTSSGQNIGYDILVLATGLQINWNKVIGLTEALGKNGVCCNYSFDTVTYTQKFIKDFTGGNAVFSQPSTPVKCAGAPQKIMYLAEYYWRHKDPNMKRQIDFFSGAAGIFGIAHYAPALARQCKERNLITHFRHDLLEVRSDAREAVFVHIDSGKETVAKYDFFHVTPPMGPPDIIKSSPFAGETGFADVNKNTLISVKYPNVFAIGDSSNLPTSKTAAAISAQAPVLVDNILSTLQGSPLTSTYHGYASCPIPVGGGKLIFCEFNYKGEPQETFPWDQREPGRLAYHVKKDVIPRLYWYGTLKGLFRGPDSLPLPWKKKRVDDSTR
jgi:sulfide:quinone oxidoreductase